MPYGSTGGSSGVSVLSGRRGAAHPFGMAPFSTAAGGARAARRSATVYCGPPWRPRSATGRTAPGDAKLGDHPQPPCKAAQRPPGLQRRVQERLLLRPWWPRVAVVPRSACANEWMPAHLTGRQFGSSAGWSRRGTERALFSSRQAAARSAAQARLLQGRAGRPCRARRRRCPAGRFVDQSRMSSVSVTSSPASRSSACSIVRGPMSAPGHAGWAIANAIREVVIGRPPRRRAESTFSTAFGGAALVAHG